jgi:hypothetical protein
MDFSLRSFAQAFESAKYNTQYKKFPVYAFILATPADRNVFPELLTHLEELHNLTGDDMLVIAPRIIMYKAPNQPMNALEISEVLAKKKYFNYYGPSTVDVSETVNKFLNDQTNQTYRFAKFINLEMNEIPCLVFFGTLESPDKYVCWSLQGTSSSDVIKDFREIMTVIQKARRENLEVLSSINFLDKKRFALKLLRKVGEVAPDWLGLFKP